MRLEFPFSIQISEDCSISELQLLLKANFETGRVGGFLAVVDESKRVIGTISDSDIRRHMPEIADASVTAAKLNGNAFGSLAGNLNQSLSVVDVYPRTGNSSATVSSGTAYLTFFTPMWSATISSLSIVSATTAASGTSLARIGLYTFDGTTATLVARTDSDTSLLSTTNTVLTRALSTTGGYPSTYTLQAGTRYALGFIFVGATPGTVYTAFASLPAAIGALAPRVGGAVPLQSDLPNTGTSFTATTVIPWGRLS